MPNLTEIAKVAAELHRLAHAPSQPGRMRRILAAIDRLYELLADVRIDGQGI